MLAASLPKFLSIQAQDFIEDSEIMNAPILSDRFLSIQAQDFIEEAAISAPMLAMTFIPEHSSSGLH